MVPRELLLKPNEYFSSFERPGVQHGQLTLSFTKSLFFFTLFRGRHRTL